VIELKCKKIEFKDIDRNPLLGILEKEDENYIHFRTRKGSVKISHDLIGTIEDTNIEFEEGERYG